MSEGTQITLIVGAWAVLIALVWGWGLLRRKALLSKTTLGHVAYHALGGGALALLVASAVIGGWRSHDFVHPLLDLVYILTPLFLIHWVLTLIGKRSRGSRAAAVQALKN